MLRDSETSLYSFFSMRSLAMPGKRKKIWGKCLFCTFKPSPCMHSEWGQSNIWIDTTCNYTW